MMSTVLLELVGLAFYGVVVLSGWPFGWSPDPGLVAVTTSMAAVGPWAGLYRAGRPPRSWAVAKWPSSRRVTAGTASPKACRSDRTAPCSGWAGPRGPA
ncbi:hypothetical protein [Streptomyces sp. NPDC012510]|uniref:hypothetical protein n=1 Tax=Streptomyces sp. NPDC012510 TaxID=3364838 RepID=UPI0036ED9CE5